VSPIVPREPLTDRIRVLIADDHRLFAESLKLMLEVEQEIDVVGYAADGGEAIALSALLRPDVVVMDLDMPVMDGIDATAGVRAAAPGTAVVIVTGSTDPRDAQRARAVGAAAYVPKEASVELLRETVCAVAPSPAQRPNVAA
jgi:DNA-binding NarL/FixJ family response regulator